MNVNFRSKTLSNLFHIPNDNNNHTFVRNDATGDNHVIKNDLFRQSSSVGGVTLDLSGNYDCHVSSPRYFSSTDTELIHHEVTTPLFRWGTATRLGEKHSFRKKERLMTFLPSCPSLHVGAKYDFRIKWYGATRLLGTLCWNEKRSERDRDTTTVHHQMSKLGTMQHKILQRIRASTVRLRVEKGLLVPNDSSAELKLQFGSSSNPINANDRINNDAMMLLSPCHRPPTLAVRIDAATTQRSQQLIVAVRAPLHRRIDIVTKSIYIDSANDELNNHFLNRIPTKSVNWTEGSWLPDVRLGLTGRLVAKSDLGISCLSSKTMPMLGVRIMASRQMNWNALGLVGNENLRQRIGTFTWLQIELCGISSSGRGCNSVSVETALERIVDTARMTIAHEQIMRS